MLRGRLLTIGMGLLLFFFLGREFCSAQEQKGVSAKESETLDITEISPGYFSMEFRDIELKDLLRVLSRDYKLNIVISKEVEGRVTASFSNITLKQALEAILKIQGYALIEEDDIIKVIKRPQINKFFPLLYISPQDIADSLSELKSSEGKIIIDDKSNTIMAIDLPENIKKMEEFIAMADVKQLQVLIEVEILETTVGTLEEVSMKWASTILSYKTPSRSTSFPLHGFIIAGEKAPSFELGSIAILPPGDEASALLKMLASHSHTRYLAKPKICVLNGEEANIDISADAVVSVKETVETTETGSMTTKEAERTKIGTTLKVTPTIDKEGFVTLKINPTVSTAVDSEFSGYVDPHERSLETVLRVKDGQTLVMGGLISSLKKESTAKVPFFGDIPLLGNLFKSKQESEEETELLIFITPHIVSDSLESKPLAQLAKSGEDEVEEGIMRVEEDEKKDKIEEKITRIKKEIAELLEDDTELLEDDTDPQDYNKYISQKISRYAQHFPPESLSPGEVTLSFTILSNGSLKEIPHIVHSSNDTLNEWAIDCIINSSPFFPFSDFIDKNEKRFKITIYYRM